jgi:hypothetical protein
MGTQSSSIYVSFPSSLSSSHALSSYLKAQSTAVNVAAGTILGQ